MSGRGYALGVQQSLSQSRSTRLFYVDDSGAERTGYATYSWIEVAIDDWRFALEDVLEWRSHLAREYGIPKNYELHAVNFANGRGNPSTFGDEWNRRKAFRSMVLDEAFERFRSWSWLRAGTVYSQSDFRRDTFARERARVYGELVHEVDDALTAAREWGLLVMDGDGSDGSYITAHRSLLLSTRSLVEDPAFQHSSRSQWVQLADLVAYAAYQSLQRAEEKRFAWDWYDRLGPQTSAPRRV